MSAHPGWLAAPLLAPTPSVITYVLLPEHTTHGPTRRAITAFTAPQNTPTRFLRGAGGRAKSGGVPRHKRAALCVCTGLAMATPLRLTASGGGDAEPGGGGSRRPPEGAPRRATVEAGARPLGGGATVNGGREPPERAQQGPTRSG